MTRAARILLVANDGFSAGHVARALAIAASLPRAAARREVAVQTVLATTSEADALLAGAAAAVVRLPAPEAARRAGLSDAERRRLVRAAIDGVVEGFAPDLVVADTFPRGPHGELGGVGRRARRALVRRAVPDAGAAALAEGLAEYDLAVIADDLGAPSPALPIAMLRVPAIALGDAPVSRADARAALDLPRAGRAWLVTGGGGGDADAAARVERIAAAVARAAPTDRVVVARGPLARPAPGELRVAPLGPYLRAFDGAFAAAGYNTVHELARAGVPAALFALPRPYDDQAARAARAAAAGLACVLDGDADDAVARALGWLAAATVPALVADGAARAADALLQLVIGASA